MFEVHFRRSIENNKDFALIAGPFKTLIPALRARKVSGDLVVYSSNHKVVDISTYLKSKIIV